MKKPVTFRQADFTRAIVASEKAGKEVTGAHVDSNGTIWVSFIVGNSTSSTSDIDKMIGLK